MPRQLTQAQWDAKRRSVKAEVAEQRAAALADKEALTTLDNVEVEVEVEVKPYAEMSEEELFGEVQERELDITGVDTREDLIELLEEEDAKDDESNTQ